MGKRWLQTLGTLLVCTVLCQGLLTSIVALGWVYRWVRRQVSQHLFDHSPFAETTTWQGFASNTPQLTVVRDYPRLFRRQTGIGSPSHPILKRLHGLFHSLWLNLSTGVGGILTTWSCTLLPVVLWATAWYVGWHISFNKLYEESETGISLGVLGMLLFMVAMVLVPAAQARHAFTGDWRSFFQVRFVRSVVYCRPLQFCLLTLGYVVSSVILTGVKVLPVFLPTINPALENLTMPEALDYLNQYYFWTGEIAFLLFWRLRTMAGKVYAAALMDLWQQATLDQSRFHPQEAQLLTVLDISYGCNQRQPRLISRFLKFPVTVSYRLTMIALTFFAWGVFGFMPFVSQFANYYPLRGFLNQPLVQLPCFRYVPTQLKAVAELKPTIQAQPDLAAWGHSHTPSSKT